MKKEIYDYLEVLYVETVCILKTLFIATKELLKHTSIIVVCILKLVSVVFMYSIEVSYNTICSNWENIRAAVLFLSLVIPSSCMIMYIVFTTIKQFESALGTSILLIAVNTFGQFKLLKYIQRILLW